MSVTTQEGAKIDINQTRDQLSRDRDSGKVSKQEYKKAMKGLNRIADADRKGVNYSFTGEGRFKTTGGNGLVSRNDSGVSAGTVLPMFGKNVSKAMGYAQSIGLTVPEAKTETAPTAGTATSGASTGRPGLSAGRVIGSKVNDMYNWTPKVQATADASTVDITAGTEGDGTSQYLSDFWGKAVEKSLKTPEQNKARVEELTQKIWDLEQGLNKESGEVKERTGAFGNFKIAEDQYWNPLTALVDNKFGFSINREKDFYLKERQVKQEIMGYDEELERLGSPRPHRTKAKIETGVSAGLGSLTENSKKPQDPKGSPGVLLDILPVGYAGKAAQVGASAIASGVKRLTAPVLQLPAPAANAVTEVGKQVFPRVFQGTTSGTVGTAMRNADQVGGAIRPQFPQAVEAVAEILRVGKKAIFQRMVPLPRISGPTPIVRKALQRVKGPSVTGPKPVTGPTPVRGPKPIQRKKLQTKFSEGGKLRSFSPGGRFGVLGIQDGISDSVTEAMKNRRKQNQFSSIPAILPNLNYRKESAFALSASTPMMSNAAFKAKGVQTSPSLQNTSVAEKRTMGKWEGRIGSATNDNSRPIDKDSLINNALGAYGAVSLLTAKKPRLRPPGEINLNIRPAQGDEDMVARSNQAIDQSVRMGSASLNQRTGSDLTSYVMGNSAMIDNAGKAKASVLGQNAQMKRQDEVRMSSEINQGKQINFGQKEQFRQEQNATDAQTYQGRVGGAQAAVNNSLNYGTQKRADERNKIAERDTMNKRYGMTMLQLAQTLEEQGLTPEQIAKRLEQYKSLSFKEGGSIPGSTRLMEGAHKNVSQANRELGKMFREYSKLISNASIENIRQFNANIRSINTRKNITIRSI